MDIKQLQHFAFLANELHFGRAADALGTSQSTLSSQIMALEKSLGVQLFERTRRVVRLTRAGTILMNDVRPILEQLDVVGEHAREAARGERGTLVVGASKPAIGSRLPAALRAFQEAYPKVRLRVRVTYSDALLDDLEKRRSDIVFARAGIEAKNVGSKVLWDLPYQLILPTGHPASGAGPVALHRVSGETLFTYPRALVGDSYDKLIAFCRSFDFVPRAIEEVDDADTILALVACRLGVTINARGGASRMAGTVVKQIAGSGNWKYSVAAYWRDGEEDELGRALLAMSP
jgi:DNA-binding transcriptional LysR family regulator